MPGVLLTNRMTEQCDSAGKLHIKPVQSVSDKKVINLVSTQLVIVSQLYGENKRKCQVAVSYVKQGRDAEMLTSFSLFLICL